MSGSGFSVPHDCQSRMRMLAETVDGRSVADASRELSETNNSSVGHGQTDSSQPSGEHQ
jgi:hypothetical protein